MSWDAGKCRAAVLRVVTSNMHGLQPDSVAESIIVELLAQEGLDPNAVHEALAALVEQGALTRYDSDRESRYTVVAMESQPVLGGVFTRLVGQGRDQESRQISSFPVGTVVFSLYRTLLGRKQR